MPRTLTIAGWPEPESATHPSGAAEPTVVSWLIPRPSRISLPAPIDPERIDSAIQTMMTLLESRDLIYIGPGCPLLDDPLAAPLRDTALQANLEVCIEPALPFWLGAIDAASGFSVRVPADIYRSDLGLPLVILALMSAPAVIDAATAVLDRSAQAPLTLIGRSGETLHFNLTSLDLPENSFPFALVPFESQAMGAGELAHLPWLQATPDPITTVAWQTWVEVNPKTAERLGIAQQDIVVVESSNGRFVEAAVYVNPASPPNVIGMPLGQGHAAYTSYAAGRGVNVFDILRAAQDADTGAFAWAATRVRLAKTNKRLKLPSLEGIVPAVQLADQPIIQVVRNGAGH